MSVDWERVRTLFFDALDTSPDQRVAKLDQACAGDEALRNEVQSLLDEHDAEHGALETLEEHELPPAMQDVLLDGLRGSNVSGYRLRRVLAQGGMGVVYEAEHDIRGQVALKMLRLGLRSRTAARRFEFEIAILRRLKHPGIAEVYDAGTHRVHDGVRAQDVPWFVMEFVSGAKPILRHAADETLVSDARVRLLLDVCEAVQYGHQRGVIHRDLKSENVLVGEDGRVRVVDYGIARLEDPERLGSRATLTGQVFGTLTAMSPEQLSGDPDAVDVRSDVYALGALAYELLVGQPPHALDGLPPPEQARRVQDHEPRRARTLNATVAPTLEWILDRALQRDKERRYPTVAHFATDLRRHLEGEPVEAGPPSGWDQLRRFGRHHRLALTVVALLVLGSLGTTVAFAIGLREARHQEARANQARTDADASASQAHASLEFLTRMLSSAGGDPQLRVKEVVDEAARQLALEPDSDVNVRASVHRTLGLTYKQLGSFSLARTHLEAALSLRETHGNRDDILVSRLDLGVFDLLDGQVEAAGRTLRHAVDERTEAYGAEDARTLDARFHLGIFFSRRGALDSAVDTLRSVLDAQQRRLGPAQQATLDTVLRLATTLTEARRIDEAIETLITALQQAESSAAPSQLWDLREQLARLLAVGGRPDDAADLYSTLVDEWRANRSRDPARAASLMRREGSVLLELGRDLEAEIRVREALLLLLDRLGMDALETLECRLQLGLVLLRRGEREEALREVLIAQGRLVQTYGDEHPTTRQARDTLRLIRSRPDGERP